MKRVFALLLALCLLALCACGQIPEATEPGTEPSETIETTEATEEIQAAVFYPRWPETVEEQKEAPDFSAVDETVPNSAGVYEIYSAEGLQQLSAHPDGKFKLLWDIDLGGAAWTPIAEFTGEIEGQKYAISNFTIQPDADGNTGFFGVNKGTVKNLQLQDVTINAKGGVVGGLAVRNEGFMSGCTVAGTMTVSDSALAGGLVGEAVSGTMIMCEAALELQADASVTLGLLVGAAENTELDSCSYTGITSIKDGQAYTQMAGREENASLKDCLWRDNTCSDALLSAESLALREIAKAETYRMGTVEWTVSETVNYIHPTGGVSLGAVFIPGTVYTGIPYTANFGDLSRFLYCFEEDGRLKDFATETTVGFDGMDLYMGCDCSGGVYWGWAKVSPTTTWSLTSQMPPVTGMGTLPVGEYEGAWTLADTMQITKANDEQTMAEAYAKLHMSDAITTFYQNPDDASDHFNHTRLIVESPVVMRKMDGTIDLNTSYVITHEQGKKLLNSTWLMYGKYTFQELWDTHYIPLTCQEFEDGKAPQLEVTIDTAGEGKAYMTTGTVQSNYRLISTNVTISDEAGEAVFDKTIFVNIRRYSDVGTHEISRYHITEQDMAAYAAYLGDMELESGKTYTYTLTANTAAGDVVVKTFTFVQ